MKKNIQKQKLSITKPQVSDLRNKDLEKINGGGIMWYLFGRSMGTIYKVGNDTGSHLMLFQ